MTKKRFIVETGTGVDLHGEDVTEAACRAVRDAISRSCLCGLQEVLELKSYDQVEVEILIASPKPEEVDMDQVKKLVPMACSAIKSVQGGMQVRGLLVPRFAPDRDQIVVANAAVTVYINQ
jgi:uncharacterized protein (TIGR02058 family)